MTSRHFWCEAQTSCFTPTQRVQRIPPILIQLKMDTKYTVYYSVVNVTCGQGSFYKNKILGKLSTT